MKKVIEAEVAKKEEKIEKELLQSARGQRRVARNTLKNTTNK